MLKYLCAAAAAAMLGCGPKDAIPSGPDHPGNPEAPIGKEPPAPAAVEEPEAHDAAPVVEDEPPGKAADTTAIAAAEKAAYQKAKPVFAKYCAKCHSSSGAKSSKKIRDHFNMDSYPFGGHHASELGAEIREVLGVTGEEPTMPADAPGSVKGAELDVLVAWSRAFDEAHAAGLHEGHEHGGHGGH